MHDLTRQISTLENAITTKADAGMTARPTVLRALTDLYCLRPEPSPDEVARYQELMLRILGDADKSTRMYVASKLARHPAAPKPVLAAISQADPACAELIVEHAVNFSAEEQMAVARGKDRALATALARRRGIGGPITEALIARADASTNRALAFNQSATFTRAGVERLAVTARGDSALSANFSARSVEPLVSPTYFLRASTLERARIIAAARRTQMGRDLTPVRSAPALVQNLRETAQDKKWQDFTAALAEKIGWDEKVLAPLVNDASGEPLALLLCCVGAYPEDAVRIFLCCRDEISHSYVRVRTLSDIVRDTPAQVAAEILQACVGREVQLAFRRASAERGAQDLPRVVAADRALPGDRMDRSWPAEPPRVSRLAPAASRGDRRERTLLIMKGA
ncbi:MAG: hypothetical protein JWN93_2831 [Hyphomicrobiales bacterium]|nr:hypothetical protein [Hyphomicrobiales bacterium]